jgi:hypothetical protein
MPGAPQTRCCATDEFDNLLFSETPRKLAGAGKPPGCASGQSTRPGGVFGPPRVVAMQTQPLVMPGRISGVAGRLSEIAAE